MKPGYIRIIDGIVKFEYYQLYKPDKKDYYHNSVLISNQLKVEYSKDYKEYEASKRTVEVSNKIQSLKTKKIRWIWLLNADNNWTRFKDNQPCRGKIENNKAEILEIL